jgi:hypothetical protein
MGHSPPRVSGITLLVRWGSGTIIGELQAAQQRRHCGAVLSKFLHEWVSYELTLRTENSQRGVL